MCKLLISKIYMKAYIIFFFLVLENWLLLLQKLWRDNREEDENSDISRRTSHDYGSTEQFANAHEEKPRCFCKNCSMQKSQNARYLVLHYCSLNLQYFPQNAHLEEMARAASSRMRETPADSRKGKRETKRKVERYGHRGHASLQPLIVHRILFIECMHFQSKPSNSIGRMPILCKLTGHHTRRRPPGQSPTHLPRLLLLPVPPRHRRLPSLPSLPP